MPRRSALLVATWVAGTLVAMLLVQGSVQLLTQRVSHQSLQALDQETVGDELERGSTSTSAATTGGSDSTDGAADGVEPGGTVASGLDGEAPVTGDGAGNDRPGAVSKSGGPAGGVDQGEPGRPDPERGDPSGPSTAPTAATAPTTPAPTDGAPALPPTTAPAAPTTTVAPAPGPVQSIVAVGGSIIVQCSGSSAQLVSSHPAGGFVARTDDWGPEEIEVRFTGSEHVSKLKAWCRAGVAASEVEEEPEDGADDHVEVDAEVDAEVVPPVPGS